MPRSSRLQARRSQDRRRREVFLARTEHEGPDGWREALEFTPDEVVVIRERDGRRVAERIPLKQLERVRTRARVAPLELMVALSYLLGASVFLYLIVNMITGLSDRSILLVLGVLTFFAAGGVAAAWFGQEAVLQFVGRGRKERVEYHVRDEDRDRLPVLQALTGLQDEK